MLSTIIADCYTYSEKESVSKYLDIDTICSPYDAYGWASAGIYSFWNIYTKEILYIGLAVDLAQRFRQHNGIISNNSNGCKLSEILVSTL